MFTNLIESDSHRKEFKRRSSFFLVTVAAYALILFAAGVASIYAYDARLEAQTSDLTLLNWIPPVTPPDHVRPEPTRRAQTANNTGRTASQPVRTVLYESASNPIKPPDTISAAPNKVQPAPRNAVLGNYDANPIGPPTGTSGCVTCTGNETGPLVREDPTTTPPPVPTPVKPKTQTVTSVMLIAKVVSLPKPSYPPMAKQIRVDGPVSVQIVVDEQGKVISAQPVSGHPLLVSAAKEAALRARFTATVLNGQAVKIQGVITYNFVLQ